MSGKRLVIGLFASLALNAVLIGALAGVWAASSRSQGGISADVRPDRDLAGERMLTRNALQLLPDDKRQAIERELAERWSSSREDRRAVMKARLTLRSALIADPYNAEAVRTAFDELRAAEDRLKVGVHETITRIFGDLGPELRAVAVRPSKRGPDGPRGGFRDRRFPGPGPDGPPPPRFEDRPDRPRPPDSIPQDETPPNAPQ